MKRLGMMKKASADTERIPRMSNAPNPEQDPSNFVQRLESEF